jgi:PAS domain S-box-containing protein
MPSTPRLPSVRGLVLAGAFTVVILIIGGWVAVTGTMALHEDADQVAHTHEIIAALHAVQVEVLNAETGQRGFLITGDPAHRVPYDQALRRIQIAIDNVAELTIDNPVQQAAIARVREQVAARLAEMARNLALRNEAGLEAAINGVASGRGRATMEALRLELDGMHQEEQRLLVARAAQTKQQYSRALVGEIIVTALALVTLWMFARLVRRNLDARATMAGAFHRDREELRVTLSSIGDGVIATDRNACITMMNRVAEDLTGWTLSEAAGRRLQDVFEIVNETSRAPVSNPVHRALSDGVVVGLANHTVLIARDGTERPIADSAAPIRDAGGEAMGAVLVFRNVAEERAAERSMREALEYARTIVDTVREPLLVITSDFTVRSASRSFFETFRTTPAETEGKSVFSLAGGQWNLPELRRWLEHAVQTKLEGESLEIATDLPGAGPSVLCLHAGHLRHGTERTGLVLLAVDDISDERTAETARAGLLAKQTAWSARLQQVAAASLTINAATTQDSVVGIIGAEARHILGAGDCEVVFDSILAEELPGTLIVPLMGRETRLLGYIRCKDKSPGQFDGDDRAILTQLAHMASIAVENARLYGELRQADLRKDEFLATLAHELRNPLAPIHHALQLLRQASNASEQQANREVIERQVRQLVHLVDDLLDVSRVSRGKLDLRKNPVTLTDVLNGGIETSQPLIEAQHHAMTVSLPPEPVWLFADLTRLAQVFSNLLNNSAKYTEPGGRIWLAAVVEGAYVKISVRDTGIGITPEMLPHVFDVFRQASNAGGRAQGGLGIGLTLVRRIVELHGGSAEAHSDGPGRGSEFIIRLPVGGGPDPSGGSTVNQEPVAQQPVTPLRVLVVDDNADSADTLAMLLRLSGHEVAVARDGYGAVDMTTTFGPELILLDIGLPGISGYEAAKRIRELPDSGRIQLVALTGWGQDDDRRRSREAGFDQHLVKPVDFDALRTLLENVRRP